MEELWLARDKDGSLYLYGHSKPEKYTENGMWVSYDYNFFLINSDLFSEVKWSDEEPIKVKIVIEK